MSTRRGDDISCLCVFLLAEDEDRKDFSYKPQLFRSESRNHNTKTSKMKKTTTSPYLLIFAVVLLATVNHRQHYFAWAQQETPATSADTFSFDDIPPCNLTTGELAIVDKDTEVEPCIVFDIQPPASDSNVSSIITVIGVFDANMGDYRDGAVPAIEALNADHEGRGAAIGYNLDHYVQFRFVAAIAGNARQLSPADYERAHQKMLESLLIDLSPQYILGTASFEAFMEKELAGRYKTILLAQVGPQSFYEGPTSNDHIFGIHIPSEDYGIPAFQALRFRIESEEERKIKKLRIVYRDRTEFFYSTCRHVYDRAIAEGFENTVAIEYNPEADHDGDGILNQADEVFMHELADQACAPSEANNGVAIWACVSIASETNAFLQRLRHNGCRPSSLWLTVASWNWAYNTPESIPFTQSGAQWHADMVYSDEYFSNGLEMLQALQKRFDHPTLPAYGALGAYHGIYLMYQNIRSFFKGKDFPQVQLGFETQYEEIRRNLLDLSVPKSLYGPTSFDEHRRNIGRGSAGLQWQIPSESKTGAFEMLLISPFDQASASVIFPAPVAQTCRQGQFLNGTRLEVDQDILSNKCDSCPIDSFNAAENTVDLACQVCIPGSTTEGTTGSNICIEHEDNLVPNSLKGFGFGLMSLVYLVALFCIGWTYYQRANPVVQLSQPTFLILICFGSIISSSSIIPLSTHAGVFEDETFANRACTAVPWLYAMGWMLQYSCISVKSYRMYALVKARRQMRRVQIKTSLMLLYVGFLMSLNLVVLIPWTIIDPLVWHRTDQGTTIDRENGVLTFESYGKCNCEHFFWWVGPLLGLQVAVMIFTNVILLKIRNVSGRYQESRFFMMASLYVLEIMLVGIPILAAVGDAVEAGYIVLISFVGLGDLGILLMIFLPKFLFAREGLPDGMSVSDSLFSTPGNSAMAIDSIRQQAHHHTNLYIQGRKEGYDEGGTKQLVPTDTLLLPASESGSNRNETSNYGMEADSTRNDSSNSVIEDSRTIADGDDRRQ